MAQESPFDAVPMEDLGQPAAQPDSFSFDYDAALGLDCVSNPAGSGTVAVLSIILLPAGLASALSFLQKPTDVSLRDTLLKNWVPCDVA